MKRTAIVVLLAVVALALMATSAFAASDGPKTVNIRASVNQKVTLTLSRVLINFGAVDPMDNTVPDESVDLTVRSNKDYTVLRQNVAADWATWGLGLQSANVFDDVAVFPKATGAAGFTHTETFRLRVPWTVDPSTSLNTNVDYTVTTVP